MTEKRSNLRLTCPHCGAFARVRRSEQLTPIYREAVLECQNSECGWRGKLALEVTRTLTPSLAPNPEVQLPVPQRLYNVLAEQLIPEHG